MPSRASLLTGHLQHAVRSMTMQGTYPGSKYDPQQCPFVPAVFRQQGYQTAQIGKWHTGTDTGYGRDWDYQIVWNRPAHPENAGHYYEDQILTFNGQERRVPGYSTDNYTDWAVEYIRGQHREANKPWYLWLCYGEIYGPTTPAARHRGTLAGNPAPVPADIFGPWPDKPAYLEITKAWTKGREGRPVMRANARQVAKFDINREGKAYDQWVQQVNECMMAVDEGVGRVLQVFDESGRSAQPRSSCTQPIKSYGLGEHGFNQKVAPYDATISSPLVHQPAGNDCPKARSAAIRSIRPTWSICSAAPPVWKCPGPCTAATFGRCCVIRKPKIGTRRLLLTSTGPVVRHRNRRHSDRRPFDGGLEHALVCAVARTAATSTCALLVEGEVEELYDLDADPEELRDLAVRAEHLPLVETLRAKTVAELRRTGCGVRQFRTAHPGHAAL